jgi:hypothetical protein
VRKDGCVGKRWMCEKKTDVWEKDGCVRKRCAGKRCVGKRFVESKEKDMWKINESTCMCRKKMCGEWTL